MRKLGLFWGIVLVFAGTAGAQSNSNFTFSLPSSGITTPNGSTSSTAAQPSILFASNLTPSSNLSTSSDLVTANPDAFLATPGPAPVPPPQMTQGVYPDYYWQGYVGYTYVRFFEVPGTQINTNGLNFSAQYYFKPWIAFDGEFVGTFGSQLGTMAKFLMGMGGIRVRKAGPYGTELWAHMLGGGAHYLPQTAYGSQHSLAYELGVGVDVPTRSHRFAYRLAVDAAGTNYFNTYQVSPKVSAGVVLNF